MKSKRTQKNLREFKRILNELKIIQRNSKELKKIKER